MDCAKDFGFINNQFIAISHNDTAHQHLHIVVNRIGFDRKTLSDNNNYKKMAAYCREMEVKYNLRQVLSPTKFLTKGLREIPRLDTRKGAIRKEVQDALPCQKPTGILKGIYCRKNIKLLGGGGSHLLMKKVCM